MSDPREPVVAPARFVELPNARTIFVGREADIDRAGLHLRRVRLLTFTGPGGIGKTRLAIEVARREADRFPGGVAFVDLSAVLDWRLALPAIANALGVRDADATTPLDAITRRLGGSEVLLVLDNLEQILDAAPDIGALIDAAPGVRIAATSRGPLHVAGEQEYPVVPLELPADDRRPSVAGLGGVESVELFVARAQSARPDFGLTEMNAAPIAGICRRLDGLPLAIELAAARVRVFLPHELLRRLERRAPVLAAGPADAPRRQQTLRDTVRWSCDLLSPTTRASFARLGVFVGGFTFESVDAVVRGPADRPELDVVEVLAELVDASLVQVETGGREDEGRYRMLETSREYALDQLSGSELEETRDRHLAYFVALAESGAEGTSGLGAAEATWIRRITVERHNLLAAMTWARDGQRSDALLRLLVACGTRFWYVSGGLSEGLRWSEQAAETAGLEPARLGAVLAHAGWMAEELGDLGRRDLFERSLDAFTVAADRTGATEATMGLAYVAFDGGDLAAANRLFAAGLAVALELADHRKTAEFLVGLGCVAIVERKPGVARERLEEACRVSRDADDWWAIAWSEVNLGYLELLEGSSAQARRLLAEGERRALAVGEPFVSVLAQASLGYAATLTGDLVAAREHLRDGGELSFRMGWPSRWLPLGLLASAVAEWLAEVGLLPEAVTLAAAAEASRWHPLLDVLVVGAKARLEDRPRRLLPPATYEACRAAGAASTLVDALDAGLAAMESANLDAIAISAPADRDRHGLSPRELEVLALVATGRTDGEIAEALFISKKTASVHVAHIKDKLGVDSRVEVALIGAAAQVRRPDPGTSPESADWATA